MTERGQIETVIPYEAPACATCRWHEVSGGMSPVGRVLPTEDTCLRFKDLVTGQARSVLCTMARGDERLCGAWGKLHTQPDAAQPDAPNVSTATTGNGTHGTAPARRGRPRRVDATSVHEPNTIPATA